MTTTRREKSLIVTQLTGGNDYLNTVVPYGEGRYYDSRSTVNIPQDRVIPIDDQVGFNPSMGPIKTLWDEGKVAIINGIGYENTNRSHFRSMDIWHTAEPDDIRREGWLGRANPSFVVSHSVPLDDAPDAYKKFDQRIDGYTKVILNP